MANKWEWQNSLALRNLAHLTLCRENIQQTLVSKRNSSIWASSIGFRRWHFSENIAIELCIMQFCLHYRDRVLFIDIAIYENWSKSMGKRLDWICVRFYLHWQWTQTMSMLFDSNFISIIDSFVFFISKCWSLLRFVIVFPPKCFETHLASEIGGVWSIYFGENKFSIVLMRYPTQFKKYLPQPSAIWF